MKRASLKSRWMQGFSLMELMIVVVIVAILAAVAIPNYQESTKKSHRAAAAQWVADVANRQHQYILDNRIYATTLAAIDMASPPDTVTDHFTVTMVASNGAPPSFTVTATGTGIHATETITINHLNQKTGPDGAWGD